MSRKAPYATPIQPVLSLLRDKLLPWLRDGQLQRVLIAQTTSKIVSLSPDRKVDGVTVGSRKRRGRAITVKYSHVYGFANIAARWPEDKMVTARLPMVACVLRGNAELKLDDHYLRFGEGHVLIIPGGMAYSDGSSPHLAESNAAGCCDILWICPWSGGVVCNVCHSHHSEHLTLGEGEHCFVASKQVAAYLSAALDQAVARDNLFGPICHRLLTVTVLLLIRELEAGHFSQPGRVATEIREISTGQDRIAQAREYINSHLDKPLTIDRVARLCYMSRAQFTKSFRAVTGKSFSQFLTERRLAEAQRLLRDTELPVRVIGEFVGLQPIHLRRLFRQHLHAAPSAYRESQWRARLRAQNGGAIAALSEYYELPQGRPGSLPKTERHAGERKGRPSSKR